MEIPKPSPPPRIITFATSRDKALDELLRAAIAARNLARFTGRQSR